MMQSKGRGVFDTPPQPLIDPSMAGDDDKSQWINRRTASRR
jgi:hypothetical protein